MTTLPLLLLLADNHKPGESLQRSSIEPEPSLPPIAPRVAGQYAPTTPSPKCAQCFAQPRSLLDMLETLSFRSVSKPAADATVDEQEEILATKPLNDLITPLVQRHIEEEKEEELFKVMSVEDATPEVSNDL